LDPIAHPDSWVETPHLGVKRMYRTTFPETDALGPTFSRIREAPLQSNSVAIDIGITWTLRREDASKHYELAFLVPGNVLELGCGRGLSTTIIGPRRIHRPVDQRGAGAGSRERRDPGASDRTRCRHRELRPAVRIPLEGV